MLKYILLFVFLVACFQIQAQEENLIDEDSTGVCFDSDPQDDYGDLQDGSDDAFDGYGELWIDDDRFVISAGTADYMPPNATFGPETYSGLTVTRKVYAYVGPNCETITRYIECFTNSTAAPITFEVKIEGDLGSDSDTQLEGTSSGDLLATKEDIWFSSSEEGLDWNNGSNDPPLAFNLYGPGAIIGLDSVFFEFGDDDLEFFYDSLTVQPGETCCIMHFITQAQTRADALAIAAALSTPDAAALAGADISNIKNFGFAVEFSAVATCIDAVNAADAGEGMVYVEVEVPNQAISGIDITVSSGGASATIPGGVGTVIIGPIPYTGGLLEVQAALSINLNNPSKLNIKGPVCGLTPDDTGDLHGPGLFCSDQGNVTAPAVLVQSVPQRVSTTAPPTTGYHYVVVDNTGGMNNLIAFNQTGLFDNLPLLTSYTVYRFHVSKSDSAAFVAALAALGNGSLDPAINKTGSFGAFCYTNAPYVLANPQPIPAALEVCEDAAGSMSGTFDLTDADATVDPGGLGTVTYHTAQAEAQMNMNPIANPGAYVSGNGSMVWARVDDGIGCPKVSEVTLTTVPKPTANITGDISVCEGATIILNGNPAGGTMPFTHAWAVIAGSQGSTVLTNNNDGTVDITGGNLPGSLTLEYTVTDDNGCSGTATIAIMVIASPPVTIVPTRSPICENAGSQPLLGFPVGGTWAGPGVTGSTFNPASAGPGTHTISYSVVSPGGCPATGSIMVTVLPAPVATITPAGPFCEDDAPFQLQGAPAGGFFSGPGLLNNQGLFDPGSGPGSYTVTYWYTDPNGCQDFDMTTIEVDPVPSLNDVSAMICLGQSIDLTTLGIVDANNTGGTLTYHSASPATAANELPSTVVTPATDATYYALMTSGGSSLTLTPGSLTTLFTSNNGGTDGGMVYFDLTVGPNPICITSIDVNASGTVGATGSLTVYTSTTGSYVGNQANAPFWGAAAATGSGTIQAINSPSTMTLSAPLTLAANTTYAIALESQLGVYGHRYTNGTGGNQAFSNADASLNLGSGSNTPFNNPIFDPRVWNGTLSYDVKTTTVGGSCTDESQIDITVKGVTNVTATPVCVNAFRYDLCITFDVQNPGPASTFEVMVGGVALGPYLYSNYNAQVAANGCFTISDASFDPTNLDQNVAVEVKDTDPIPGGMQCSGSTTFNEVSCYTCPTVGPILGPIVRCDGNTFDLTVIGLSNMSVFANGDQNYGIEFVYFPAPVVNPYVGGTSLGTVPFFGLGGFGTIASLTGLSLPVGTYRVYARLSPAPNAVLNCRPSSAMMVVINPNPVAHPAMLMVCEDSPTGPPVEGTFQLFLANGTVTGGANNVTVSYHANPADAMADANRLPISYTTVSTIIWARVTDNATGCFATSQVTLTVKPAPVVTIANGSVCSGTPANLVFTPNANVQSYTWPAPVVPAGLQGPALAGAGGAITDIFVNTTINPIDVIYIVTATGTNGCISDPAPVTLTVNPGPVLANNLSKMVCSGELTGITLSLMTGSMPASSYRITATVDPGLMGTPTTGNGLAANAIANDVFDNYTGGPLNVTYHVTPMGSCEGPTTDVVVMVKASNAQAGVVIDGCEFTAGCNYTIIDLTSFNAQVAPGGCTVTWYIGTGTAFPVANPTAFQYGSTTLTVVVTCPGSPCTSQETVQLNLLDRPAPPTTTDLIYCVGDPAGPLMATGLPNAIFAWYTSEADALSNTNAMLNPPTPNTASGGVTSWWVTQTNAAGCESRPSELEVTVVGISNLTTTYRCVGVGPTTTYQLCFKFDRTTVGPSSAFTVQVGAVTFGPYTYSGYDLNVANNAGGCFALLDPSFVPDGQTVTITVRDVDANCGASTTFTEDPCANLGIAPILALNGAFDATNGLMRDDLRQQNLIPMSEPYTALGFTHIGGGGGEMVSPAVLQVTGPDAIVDWVFVELRDPNNTQTVLSTRSALLQRDGDIVDVDGVSALGFYALTGSYNVSVRHRNHLGAMTLNSVPLTAIGTTVDFGTVATYGTNATVNVAGTNTLVSGNVIPDGRLQYSGPGNDRAPILSAIGGLNPTAVIFGIYDNADVNMDGVVKYSGPANDRAVILNNLGNGSDPTMIRFEQVP